MVPLTLIIARGKHFDLARAAPARVVEKGMWVVGIGDVRE